MWAWKHINAQRWLIACQNPSCAGPATPPFWQSFTEEVLHELRRVLPDYLGAGSDAQLRLPQPRIMALVPPEANTAVVTPPWGWDIEKYGHFFNQQPRQFLIFAESLEVIFSESLISNLNLVRLRLSHLFTLYTLKLWVHIGSMPSSFLFCDCPYLPNRPQKDNAVSHQTLQDEEQDQHKECHAQEYWVRLEGYGQCFIPLGSVANMGT